MKRTAPSVVIELERGLSNGNLLLRDDPMRLSYEMLALHKVIFKDLHRTTAGILAAGFLAGLAGFFISDSAQAHWIFGTICVLLLSAALTLFRGLLQGNRKLRELGARLRDSTSSSQQIRSQGSQPVQLIPR
jgi:hypothetical protein